MLKQIRSVFLVVAVFLVLTKAAAAAASQTAPPQPPPANPHPPITDVDKKRVAFAEMVIAALLVEPSLYTGTDPATTKAWANDPNTNLNINSACLANKECLSKNASLKTFLTNFKASFSALKDHQHTHIIPWSLERFNRTHSPTKGGASTTVYKEKTDHDQNDVEKSSMPAPVVAFDEYMFHTYIQFKSATGWHHMDIIVSEDNDGNITLRRFFIVPMPYHERDLPPGVVC